MEKIINFDLIKSPVNWAIVFLMIALAGSLLALIIPNDDPSSS